MHEHEIPSPQLLAWRITQLEESIEQRRHDDMAIEKAMQLEIHDLRTELRTMLRSDYLTTEAMRNTFVTRDELTRQATVRREWPVIIATVLIAASTIANLVITIAGGH